MNQSTDINKVNLNDNTLFNKIADAILLARKQVSSTVNLVMVHAYFQIGRMIVEDEQGGEERASYGKSVLKDLSKRLTEKFSRGFSVDNLQNMILEKMKENFNEVDEDKKNEIKLLTLITPCFFLT